MKVPGRSDMDSKNQDSNNAFKNWYDSDTQIFRLQSSKFQKVLYHKHVATSAATHVVYALSFWLDIELQ
ncbi:unnamed protein product [Allacma fusca]|uniref:Uncharacterized protein n=1 Tax=Allacma fusca TaxID=39272 RepID=A0A8J2JZY0_9HEXA|nr:unnamed protein product [Allacma fusca]